MADNDERIERIKEQMRSRSGAVAVGNVEQQDNPAGTFDIGFAPSSVPEPMDRIGADLVRLDADLERTGRLVRAGVASAVSPIGLQEQNLRSKIRQSMQSEVRAVTEVADQLRRQIGLNVANETAAFGEVSNGIQENCSVVCTTDDFGNVFCEERCSPIEPPIFIDPPTPDPIPPGVPLPGG